MRASSTVAGSPSASSQADHALSRRAPAPRAGGARSPGTRCARRRRRRWCAGRRARPTRAARGSRRRCRGSSPCARRPSRAPRRRGRSTPPSRAPSATGSELERERALQLGPPAAAVRLDLAAPSGARGSPRPRTAASRPPRALACSPCSGSKNAIESAGPLTARAAAARPAGARWRCPPRRSRGAPGRWAGATVMRAVMRRAISLRGDPQDQRAGGRQQQRQADDVGDEPGRDQEGAAEDHRHAVLDLAVGHPTRRQGLVEAAPHASVPGSAAAASPARSRPPGAGSWAPPRSRRRP